MLVLRRRESCEHITQDQLAAQLVQETTQHAKHADPQLFTDADMQMASYAATLRVLTRYAVIDGQDMTSAALQPRARGEQDLAAALIDLAVSAAGVGK